MHQLRPHLAESEFVARVRRQQQQGYHLAFRAVAERPVAVAGFRFTDSLAWGHSLYVDDLVTLAAERSKGHGRALLRWLAEQAHAAGCAELHLDSGTHRIDAHRFYQREGMAITSYHFAMRVDG
jgi:GNAT superfamily N-acetyltransferase